jgi:hypothetical protein
MPDSAHQLGRGRVSQVEVIEEDSHARCLHGFAYVGVAPFCRVPKKRGVAQGRVRPWISYVGGRWVVAI